MRTQKIYIGYCIVTWTLWLTVIVLTVFSGNAFDVKNMALYQFTNSLSNISVLLSWIPIHPVVCIIASGFASQKRLTGYIIFNVVSFVVTTVLAFGLLMHHIVLIGGV